jgi:hypothetical protein
MINLVSGGRLRNDSMGMGCVENPGWADLLSGLEDVF